jgi:hypothetical protein
MAGGEGTTHSRIVMLNSFQHPWCLTELTVPVEKWTRKQVQGDGFVIEP